MRDSEEGKDMDGTIPMLAAVVEMVPPDTVSLERRRRRQQDEEDARDEAETIRSLGVLR